jgi:tRNA/tmRNA/rRNA uracil-C5-methylase (TrmA/RlmC/RlmD family)
MKKITFILATLALLSTMSVSAQTTKPTTDQRVAALEKEVKTLSNDNRTIKATVADLENRLSQLSDRNAEYKKELDIRQVVDTMDVDGYRYQFQKAIGNLKNGNLEITVYVRNTGKSRCKYFTHAILKGYDQVPYRTYDFSFGQLGNNVLIETNQGMMLTITFEKIPTTTKRIDVLTINSNFEGGGLSEMSAVMHDLPIEWKDLPVETEEY